MMRCASSFAPRALTAYYCMRAIIPTCYNALDRDRFFDRLSIEANTAPIWQGSYLPNARTSSGAISRCSRLARDRATYGPAVGARLPIFLKTRVWLRCSEGWDNSVKRISTNSSGLFVRHWQRWRYVSEPRWPGYTPTEPETSANPQRLLEAASAMGNHLEMLALRGKDDVSWLGLKLTSKRHWSLVPLESDLYAGIPGVLLFLALSWRRDGGRTLYFTGPGPAPGNFSDVRWSTVDPI